MMRVYWSLAIKQALFECQIADVLSVAYHQTWPQVLFPYLV